jgi:NAD(P)-dependent dehydrogenase (short-subunit alcohol dehydrogenase family)
VLLIDKVAIISGVGPGLGRDIALLFAEHGAAVVVGARTLERCHAVAEEVRAAGGRAEPVHLDITDPVSCEAAVATASDAFGGLDVLVNNAFRGGSHRHFEDSPLDEWRATMDVNLWGTLQMTKAAVPALVERGEGRVVMVNSMSAHRLQPRYGAYATSKGALETATRSLALELGEHGIRVNGVFPGYIWADTVEQYFAHQASQRGVSPEEVYREVADETALRYLPTSREIAGSVLFFASDLSRPVTGQSLGVDAGHWIA